MIEGLIMEEKGSNDSGSPVINSENSSPPVSGGSSDGVAGGVAVVVPPAVDISNGGVVAVGTETGGGVVVGGQSGIDSSGKRKRGRPRKYDENGNLTASYMKSAAQHAAVPLPPPGFYSTPPGNVTGKRGRGRPAGSGSSQLIATMGEFYASTAGKDFTPHVLIVNPGEDVAEKIFSLVRNGTRGVCVLSANGAISNVTIRQPCSAGGTLTYEGCFEMISLTGSYTLHKKNGINVRNGSLSVALAGADGSLIGGGLAGMLRAAAPIQMVLGSFEIAPGVEEQGNEQKKRKPYGQRSEPPNAHPAPVFPALPISQAPPNGNLFPSPPPPQPHVGAKGEAFNNPTYSPIRLTNVTGGAGRNGVDQSMQQRPSPDINVSAPMEE